MIRQTPLQQQRLRASRANTLLSSHASKGGSHGATAQGVEELLSELASERQLRRGLETALESVSAHERELRQEVSFLRGARRNFAGALRSLLTA